MMTTWLALNLANSLPTSLTIWCRLPSKLRPLALLAFVLLMPVSWAVLILNGGWAIAPTPYIAELPADGDILGLKLEPDVAIYLMLDVDGVPRVFRLPWSNAKASQLQRLVEAQDGSGGSLKARKGQKTDGSDTTFHEEPQPAAPEKQAEQPGLQYQRSAS